MLTTSASVTGLLGTYWVNVTMTVDDPSVCQPYPLVYCTFSGTITSDELNLVIGPTASQGSWDLDLYYCGQIVSWTFQVTTDSQLTLVVKAPDGSIAYMQTSHMSNRDNLNGAYDACYSSTTTTTVGFPTVTSTNTITSTVYYPYTIVASLTNLVTGNKTVCGDPNLGCSYSFQWDVLYVNDGCTPLLCSDGASTSNMTATLSFSCIDKMFWSFSMDTNETELVFEIKDVNGTVLLHQDTVSSQNDTLTGTWQPQCSTSTTTTTMTTTFFSSSPASTPSIAVTGILAGGAFVALATFFSQRGRRRMHGD